MVATRCQTSDGSCSLHTAQCPSTMWYKDKGLTEGSTAVERLAPHCVEAKLVGTTGGRQPAARSRCDVRV